MADIISKAFEKITRQSQSESTAGPTQMSPANQPPSDTADDADQTAKHLPRGVALGKDGKPCRSCTSFAAWAAMAKKQPSSSDSFPPSPAPSKSSSSLTDTSSPAAATPVLPADCPPDVDTLGTHTWTLLHSLSAAYPAAATRPQQAEMAQFLALFARLYPCWVCADDFRAWMESPANRPRLTGRAEFGRWMCDAHNAVNHKLGKPAFDCARWEERWRDGWRDGRCD